MVPLGVITVAVVLAWGRFYQTIGEVVCDVAGALGSGAACAPGDIPDLSALLSGEGLPNGDGPGSVRCLSAASRSDPECAEEFVVRLQAQGSGLQKSVTIRQKTPVTATQAIQGLAELKESLTRAELALRDEALRKAEAWIRAAALAGGVGPPGKSGFTNRGVRGSVARIDVEVLRGTNLVPP